VALAEALDLVDFEGAAEVSGAKFYYLRNAAALLELALVNWSVSRALAAGFTPLMTPDLVKEAVLEKCGFQPRASNTQVGRAGGRAGGCGAAWASGCWRARAAARCSLPGGRQGPGARLSSPPRRALRPAGVQHQQQQPVPDRHR
jgi:seryl-tRNA synthetase